MAFKLILLITILAYTFKETAGQKKLVCYFTNWSQYRSDVGRFLPENIDPQLCTHIIYAFAKINVDRIAPYEWNDENSGATKGMFARVTDLKRLNPSLKVLLAIGGWTFGSAQFSSMVSNPMARSNFIYSSINYLRSYGFDGLDLDWEFPAYGSGSSPNDKYYFTVLVKEAKPVYTANGLLLTAAAPVNPVQVEAGYEVDQIANNLDWVTLMSYNYHGTWDSTTGFNAPLYPRASETGQDRLFNVDSGVNYWISKGFPKEKIIVGVTTYGRSFKLNQTYSTSVGSAAYAGGTAGTWTKEPGFLSAYEICQKLAQGWTRSWNTESQVPYAQNGYEWVGYDDVQSFKAKADYINLKNLGGAMVWSLDLDDFTGSFCGNGKFPLINTIKSALMGSAINVNPAPAPAPTTGCAQSYFVASGDSCWAIWTRFALTEAQFYSLNPAINCAALKIGQSTCVKQSSSSTSGTCPSIYNVVSGDTCWAIWTKNGLAETQFYSLNPSINCAALQVGQALNVLRAC